MPSLITIEAFVAVARHSSFTKAADDLNVSRTMISRYVQALEQELGVKLLNRTTRAVHLTEVGEAYLEQVQAALKVLKCAGERVADLSGNAVGRLRVALPATFSTLHLHPVIVAFQENYPEIELELDMSDAKIDLIAGGFDAALRIGPTPDSSFRIRKIAGIRRILCAAPAYLTRHGQPETPQYLGGHNCLDYRHMAERTQWILTDGKQEVSVFVGGDVRANNGEFLTKLAIAGRGIINVPTFIVHDELKTGKLVQVLPSHTPPTQNLCVVFPSGQAVPLKLRVFIDFVAQNFRGPLPWEKPSAI